MKNQRFDLLIVLCESIIREVRKAPLRKSLRPHVRHRLIFYYTLT